MSGVNHYLSWAADKQFRGEMRKRQISVIYIFYRFQDRKGGRLENVEMDKLPCGGMLEGSGYGQTPLR